MFKQKTLLVILLVAIIALCAVAIHKGYSTKEGYTSRMSNKNTRKRYAYLMKILDNNVTFTLNDPKGTHYNNSINDVRFNNNEFKNMMNTIGSEFTDIRTKKNPYKDLSINQLKRLSNSYQNFNFGIIDVNKLKYKTKFESLLFGWVLKHAEFYTQPNYR